MDDEKPQDETPDEVDAYLGLLKIPEYVDLLNRHGDLEQEIYALATSNLPLRHLRVALLAHVGMTTTDDLALHTGMRPDQVRRIQSDLVDRGMLQRKPRGTT